jgi:hypothetical protein
MDQWLLKRILGFAVCLKAREGTGAEPIGIMITSNANKE